MNKIFSSRLFYIIFSILVAIVLWMYVEISENQDVNISIDAPIVYLREDVFRDRNLLITSRSPQVVTLTIDCPRSVVQKLNSSTVSVTVDLAGVSSVGFSQMRYEVVYPADVNRNTIKESRSVERINLLVDRLHSRDVPVYVIYNGGTSSSEFVAETPEFSPQSITVFGPETLVSKISKAEVVIMRENLSTTYMDDLPFVLYDEDGNELEDSLYNSLTFNQDSISVTVPIKMTKDVALTVELVPGAGASVQNTKVTIDPSIITISGAPDTTADFNSIMLGSLDLTKFDFTDSEMFTIVLPNIYTNLSGETEALVSVEVMGVEIEHFFVTNLHVVNKPPEYEATVVTQSIDVKVRGRAEDLAAITQSNIRVVADLAGFSQGTSTIPARVYIDGDVGDIGAIGDYKITVRLDRA